MGKYSHLIDKLPRYLGTEPAYQEKVQAVKDAILADPDFKRYASTLAEEYRRLRATIDDVKETLSDLNLHLEAYSQLIVDQFEVEGLTSLKLTDRSVSVQFEPHAKVENKEAFRLWCLTAGLEKSMVLPPATTTSLVKERLLEGLAEPDGVTASAKATIVLRKI